MQYTTAARKQHKALREDIESRHRRPLVVSSPKRKLLSLHLSSMCTKHRRLPAGLHAPSCLPPSCMPPVNQFWAGRAIWLAGSLSQSAGEGRRVPTQGHPLPYPLQRPPPMPPSQASPLSRAARHGVLLGKRSYAATQRQLHAILAALSASFLGRLEKGWLRCS